ncbi:InlB B-repeat-containing protein, partial [Faecalicoccus pleomorphus]|uniref:InlB B-repeat-containing protein n=1 Tax=Faecalicoccus pleomorphus TaxID=1323 RepID=UPI0026EEC909
MQKSIKKMLSVLIVFGMIVSSFTSSVTPTYGEDITEQPATETTAETPTTKKANQTTESNVPQKTDTSPSEQTATGSQATTEVETTPQEEPTTQTATNEEDTNTTSNEEEKVSYPAQNFSKSAGKITVHVSAVEGIFPEGTTMTITPVSSTKATQIAKQTITGNEKVEDAIGVDITFYDSSGNEIEPKDGQGVQVNMQLNESLKGKDFTVVHQEDNGNVQTVSNNASAQGATFNANAFSIYVITGIGTEDQDPAVATYQFHDANGNVISSQKVKNGETLTAPESPEKEGNIFKGWATSQDATAANFDITQPVSVEKTSTVDLYPVFSQKLYVFFLDKSGRVINTKEGAPGDVITTSDVSVPLGSEESVTGWYTDASLTNPVSEVTLEDHNVTLYPKIESGHYLYFSTGDNASYIEPEFVAAGKQTQKPNDPTRPGYTFKGWSTTEGGSVNYNFGQTLSDNQTIYAVWSANRDTSYTVIYWKQSINDSKDATNSSKTYDYENSETRTGKTGDVVSPSSSDKNKNYTGFRYNASKSTSVSINGDGTTVLNVYYDRISMTIHFQERSFWDGTTTLYTYTGLYGQTLKQNGYSWPSPGNGKCWQESDNTILTFLDAFIFDKLTHTTDGNGNQTLTLTKEDYSAVRTIHHYKQNLNGSYTTPTNSTQAGNGSFTFTNKYTGFTVSQYRLGSNGSWTNTSAGQSVPGSRQDLYVRYTRNSYELAFYNYNGVSREESVLYEQSLNSFANYTPARPSGIPDSFTFQGWYKDPETTQKFDFHSVMPAAGLTLYAKWAAPTYTATIHTTMSGDGMTIPIDVQYGEKINPSLLPTVKDADGNILSEGSGTIITIPENTEWIGWATKDGNNYTTFNLDTQLYSDIVLYPHYLSTQKYTITYDANGGGGSVTDPKHYVNGTYADIQSGKGLTAPNKKSFLYWATDKNGSGTTYYPGDKIEVTGNMTLYAIYGDPAKTTSLTYHSNYPDGVELTKKQTINNSDELENNVSFKAYTNTEAGFAVPNGYYFDGWKDSSGKSIQAGETILVDNTSDNDLYAQWKKKKSLVIQVTGNEASHVYDGKSHSASGYTLSYTVDGKATSGLPSGLTLDESAAQAKAATGKKAGTYAMGLTAGDFEVTGNDLNKYSISIQVSDGHLLVTKRQVTLTSESATKKYDGKALTKPDVTVSGAGFVDDEVSNIKATGSITKVGSTKNTITYTENSDFDKENYDINIKEGTLTITQNIDEIVVTAHNASKIYDGTPLTESNYKVKGLPDGFTAKVTTSGSITDFGEINNVIQTVVIKDSDGKDVTDQFANIVQKNGILTITKRHVTLISESASKAYDGKELTKPDVTVGGDGFVEGEVSDIKAIGSITEVGNVANTITYTTHDGFKESNYEITKNEGTLTITPNTDKITVTAKSNEKTYDGKALSQDGYKVTGLPDGFTVKVTTEGSITDVGSTENKIASVKILKGDEDVTDQFSNIETKNGTLTVNPRKVTLTSESDSKTYDGTPLTNSKVTVCGDGFVEGEVSDIKATGSQMYVGS